MTHVIAAMTYDDAGKYRGSDFLGADKLPQFQSYRDIAMAHAEPFAAWWARYGE
ncbi:hypothetical protein LN042_08925 [Kitasatospora sp. RB6PN24]|uniref:hypothetical protein n=1 Tax=Kitasatospora humi TaxID=2893891 RepID=UPI001E2E1008|nr:hypothetical protein [Kitasatospora humi]MCC9307222.1 hypothetical protein [Kitasatospora humi]